MRVVPTKRFIKLTFKSKADNNAVINGQSWLLASQRGDTKRLSTAIDIFSLESIVKMGIHF